MNIPLTVATSFTAPYVTWNYNSSRLAAWPYTLT